MGTDSRPKASTSRSSRVSAAGAAATFATVNASALAVVSYPAFMNVRICAPICAHTAARVTTSCLRIVTSMHLHNSYVHDAICACQLGSVVGLHALHEHLKIRWHVRVARF